MKLKYFLRGLASGIVVTTLILTIAFNGRKDEIEKKAKESVAATEKPQATQEVTPTEEAEVTKEVTPTGEAEVTKEVTPTGKAEVTKEATPTPVVSEQPAPTATVEPTPTTAVAVGGKKELTIVPGMWSDKVARELSAMGIIQDAADFDKYLVDNGYANRIVVGTFEIPMNASYEEIARIITGK